MATIETIGTTGRDFSTIQAWEDAIPATPTGGYEGHCYNDSEFTAGVVIDGHTTSAANYILLTAAAGQSFQDHADVRTNPLFYDQTKGVGIAANPFAESVVHLKDEHTRITRLQIKRNGSSYSVEVAESDSLLTGAEFRDCIIQKDQEDDGGILIIRSNAAAYNCVLIDNGGGDTEALAVTSTTVKNITVVRATGLASGGTGAIGLYSATLENVAVFGFATAFSGSFHASCDFNATDAATATGGSNDLTSLTYADQFESTTGDFRLKTGSDLIDAGNTDATNAPNDISGTARGTTTDGDIGAWEFVDEGGGGEETGRGPLVAGKLVGGILVRLH